MSITERLRARKVANVIEVEGDTPRIRGQMPDALCIEAADEIDRLSADLREEQDRRQAMRTEWGAEVAALTAQARHAEDCLEAAKARITELEAKNAR